MGLPVGASAPNTPANRRQTALPIDNNSINIDYQVPSSSRMLAENCARQRDNNANRNDDDLDDRVVAAFDVNQTSPSTTATTNTATTTTTATMINNGNNSIFVDHQNNNHGHQQEEHHQYNPIHPTAHHNQSNNNEQLSAICNHQLYMPPAESYSCQACVGHQRQECNNFTSDKMTSIHPSDDFTQNASHGFYDLREQGSFDGSSRAHEGSSSRPVSLESRYEHEEYQSSDESFHSHSHLSFGNSHQQQNHHQQVIHHRGHDEQPQQQISLHAQSQLVQISTGNDQGERREFSQNQTHRSSVDCSFHFEQFDINKPTFNLTTSTHDPPAIINDRHQQVDSLIHHIDSHALKLTSVGGDFNNNNNSNHQPLINGTSFTTLLHDHQPGLNSSNQHIQDSYCDQSLVNNQHPEELYHNSYTHDGGNLQQQPQQQQQQQQQQFHQQDNYYQHEESQKSFESDLNGQIADRGSSQHLSSVSFDSRPTNNSSLVTYEQEQHFSQFQSSYPQQQNMQTEVNTQFDEHRHLYQISETFSDNNHQVNQEEFSTNDAMCNQNVCKKPINESYTSLLQLTLDCTNHINQVSTTNTLLSDSPTQIGDKCRASKGKRGRPRKKNSRSKHKANGKLWEFIRDLLLSDRTNPSFIRWERREDGVFKFVQSDKVAKMWGERKQNPKMTYEKLSRAMRYYYKSKVLLPVFGRRLVYKFGPNATGWLKMIE